MKLFFLLLLITPCLPVFCQDDSVEIKFAPTLTTAGTPAGKKVSLAIDQQGGRLTSADRRIELVIPRDAVSSATNFSIQPISNTLSPGKADAYQLEPSGINFQKPLQLVFHYTEKEADGVMPEYKGIAWQDDKGQWYRLDNAVVDTTAHTVTGSITHFSRWVDFDAFSLDPGEARVKVNRELYLTIICTGVPSPSGPVMLDSRVPVKLKFTTYVDGIRGGSNVTGKVSRVYGNGIHFLKYTAPATVPAKNPVALSVETTADFTLDGTTYHRLKLVSNITIIDKAYEIIVTAHNKENVLGCTMTGFDTSTCIVELAGKNSKMMDMQNKPYKITISHCDCDLKEINPGSGTGPVEVVGASRIDVVPDSARHNSFVTIYFTRTYGIIPGMSRGSCHGQAGFSWPAQTLPAMPIVLQFETKDEEQTILKHGDENNGFEIKVKPVKGDN